MRGFGAPFRGGGFQASVSERAVRADSSLAGRIALLFACSVVALASGKAFAAVLINEIHFHPPAPFGKSQEFVELKNSGTSPVDLSGWRLEGGIEFEFASGASLDPGELLVLARNPLGLVQGFPSVSPEDVEMFTGALDNDGDVVRLVDDHGAYVDGVVFDDRWPWPVAADGGGESLQRQCSEESADSSTNWQAGVGAAPTPLADNANLACPLPSSSPPRIAINEIHFHPLGDREHLEEFVELHNPGGEAVDLSGWRLEGVSFVFPEGSVLEAGAFLAVCRDAEFIRGRFGIDNVVGDFPGKLANAGERLVLRDRDGSAVDSVRYRDHGDWPWVADGAGRSLEKIDPLADSNDPASWTASLPASSEFERLEAIGSLSTLSRQRLLLSNNGPGEYIVDDLRLEPVGQPGVNLVTNGDFENGLEGISVRGIAESSVVEEGIGVGGSAALRLITDGDCQNTGCTACVASNSAFFQFRQGDLDPLAEYRLSLSLRYVRGTPRFSARILSGVELCIDGLLASPGMENGARSATLPPFISDHARFPREPASADRPSISARVRTPSNVPLRSVELVYFVEDGAAQTLQMRDDGASRDGNAGDGVYGVVLPDTFPHDTIVYYRIQATAENGQNAVVPRVDNLQLDENGNVPASEQRSDLWGFYVNDDQPESVLPTYGIRVPDLVSAVDPTAINDILDCDQLVPASFFCGGEVYPEVGIRFRGNTACILTKRNLKIRFRRGRYFAGLRKMNLQGIWTDKSLVREKLAWDFIRQLGIPYCETEHVRLHLNGIYHGLFLYLEHPDGRFLDRNGLDGDDCLYKARQPSDVVGPIIGTAERAEVGDYAELWEQETCEDGDLGGLAAFLGAMHQDSRSDSGPTALFFLENTNPDHLIGYQIAQVVLNNIDSFAKNHFLYRDVAGDRWSILSWDMDLVFGKFFDARIAPVGTLNDCMLTSHPFELNPWFSTTVQRNVQRLYIIDFFLNADDGYFQRSYLVRLWDILREKYRNEVYDPILDEEIAFLESEQREDFERWGRSAPRCSADCPLICADTIDMASNVAEVKRQILLHRIFLLEYLRDRHPEIEDHPRLKITELMFNPTTGDPGQGNPGEESSSLEFVELLNTTGREIDIGEWTLTGGVRAVFPRGTSVPKDGVVVFAKSKRALLARYPGLEERAQVFGDYEGSLSNNGETLRVVDSGGFGASYPAIVDYLEYRDGGDWPDVVPGYSIELIVPADETDNDEPYAWQQSRLAFGSPGSVDHSAPAVTFVRGDATADGDVNLSDAVKILNHLFLGDIDLRCRDAADADDDGQLVITDATYVLNFLFLAGPTLPAPYPEAGIDTTEDGLDCAGA